MGLLNLIVELVPHLVNLVVQLTPHLVNLVVELVPYLVNPVKENRLHLVKAGQDLLLPVFHFLQGGGLSLNPPLQVAQHLGRLAFHSGHTDSFSVALTAAAVAPIIAALGYAVKRLPGLSRRPVPPA